MNSKESELYSKCRRIQEITIDMFYRKLKFFEGDRVLDVGCGSGDFTTRIAKLVQSVIGLDISENMIEYAKQHNQLDNVQYVVCGAQDFGKHLSTWENYFDRVVSMIVMHWVKDKKKAIQNIKCCLKQGGDVFILVNGPMLKMLGNNPDELGFYLKNHIKWKALLDNYQHGLHNDLTFADWTNLLEMEGFTLVHGEVKTPCEELVIPDDTQLKGYLRTLLGHLNYLPEEYHDELLQDAFAWCKQELPVNSDGIMYFATELYFIHAKLLTG